MSFPQNWIGSKPHIKPGRFQPLVDGLPDNA